MEGIAGAIEGSRGLKLYVANVMTQEGETEGYTVADHIRAIFDHSRPGLIDLCLVNSAPIPSAVQERYAQEGAVPLAVDRERIASLGPELVERPVASENGNYARHDPDRLAQAVLEVYRGRAVRIFRGARRYILEE